jgi:regulator of replication initiation timing
MRQLWQTEIEGRDAQARIATGRSPVEEERDRLQLLVGELLSENQRLRFENHGLRAKAALLEQETRRAQLVLKEATKWAGMVL